MSRIERFRTAQDSHREGFETAMLELRTGGKRGHWIWYIFPQIRGLGVSGTSQMYAIQDEDEAVEFLRDPELRARLLSATQTVAEQLNTGTAGSLVRLMGGSLDAKKLVSSLTLFGDVARRLYETEGIEALDALARTADDVLARAASEGLPACAYTLRQLRGTA